MKKYIILAVVLSALGCIPKGATIEEKVNYLQRGNATGELEINSDGEVGGGISTRFDCGASKTSFRFIGKVDFSKPPGSGVPAGAASSQPTVSPTVIK